MEEGLRLPALHCCYLGPHDFYRRVYFGTSASHCTVARGPRSHTRTYLAQLSPLHLITVAGELFGLVPALRRTHVALRLWLARDHPSNLYVEPDILHSEWEGARARDARAFANYLQRDLGRGHA